MGSFRALTVVSLVFNQQLEYEMKIFTRLVEHAPKSPDIRGESRSSSRRDARFVVNKLGRHPTDGPIITQTARTILRRTKVIPDDSRKPEIAQNPLTRVVNEYIDLDGWMREQSDTVEEYNALLLYRHAQWRGSFHVNNKGLRSHLRSTTE